MRLSLSRSQIEQLGKRLVSGPDPDPGDLESLHELLRGHGEVLGEAVATVREQIGFVALTADSEEDLRRTHARYFLDLGQLVDRMR